MEAVVAKCAQVGSTATFKGLLLDGAEPRAGVTIADERLVIYPVLP